MLGISWFPSPNGICQLPCWGPEIVSIGALTSPGDLKPLRRHVQVINPKKDLPVGLLGSLGVVTVLYVLMAATIILIVPYTQIDPKAAFAAAFQVLLTLTCA